MMKRGVKIGSNPQRWWKNIFECIVKLKGGKEPSEAMGPEGCGTVTLMNEVEVNLLFIGIHIHR